MPFNWIGGNGSWTDPGFWKNGPINPPMAGVPTENDQIQLQTFASLPASVITAGALLTHTQWIMDHTSNVHVEVDATGLSVISNNNISAALFGVTGFDSTLSVAGALLIDTNSGISSVYTSVVEVFDFYGSTVNHLNANTVTVGDIGFGQLIVGLNHQIYPGQAVISGPLTLGNQATGNGTVQVSGNSNSLTAQSTVVVGDAGKGKIQVDSGATFDATGHAVQLGLLANSSGTVNVTGLFVSDQIEVGFAGFGDLEVTGGGEVQSTAAFIGSSAANNVANVTGTGSLWTISEGLSVGDAGTGTLNIKSHGEVDVTSALGAVSIGGLSSATGNGTVLVDGAGSLLNVHTSIVRIGDQGIGRLTVQNGGAFNAGRIDVAEFAGSTGTFVIDTTQVINATFLNIGGTNAAAGGTGLVDVLDGSKFLVSGNMTVWGHGTLEISAPANLESQVVVTGTALINGLISVSTNGDLAIDGAITGTGTIDIGDSGLVVFGAPVAATEHIVFQGPHAKVALEDSAHFNGVISGFAATDIIDLSSIAYNTGTTVQLVGSTVIVTPTTGTAIQLNLDPANLPSNQFVLQKDAADGGTDLVLGNAPANWQQSPIVLSDFSGAQGWGSLDNPREFASVNFSAASDYLGFGADAVFAAFGGTWADGQGHINAGFANMTALVHDFGTNEGYTASVQRGAANTGFGVADIIYGQGFAGVYWYGANSQSTQTDAGGHTYHVPQYDSTLHFYANFGSQQGWTPDNGFQIIKAAAGDAFASILGFGNAGIVVGPQAFAPGADASQAYVVPLAAGNDFGWKQSVDIRTFTTWAGKAIDLNGDGLIDFVGMGPNGLVDAFGGTDAFGRYTLGSLQTAHISGANSDLGEAQGWTDSNTLRFVQDINGDGRPDVVAFGAPGIFVSLGQDPASHGGEAFGQLYLAMSDFGLNQGWSNGQTPRLVGDVNGDGVADIVGFGASATFVALGSKDASGKVTWAVNPNLTLNDFGYNEGWSTTQHIRALADVDGSGHQDLVLSGASGTQVWDLV